MGLIFQPPAYGNSASVYQTEMGSPAPAIASHPAVTNKVSAWLEQTHHINSTTNGESHQKSSSRRWKLFLVTDERNRSKSLYALDL